MDRDLPTGHPKACPICQPSFRVRCAEQRWFGIFSAYLLAPLLIVSGERTTGEQKSQNRGQKSGAEAAPLIINFEPSIHGLFVGSILISCRARSSKSSSRVSQRFSALPPFLRSAASKPVGLRLSL